MCTKTGREEECGCGVQDCWEVVLKLLVSKRSYLLYRMIPELAMDYSQSKTRFKEISQEAIYCPGLEENEWNLN